MGNEKIDERRAEANRRREAKMGKVLRHLVPGPVWRFFRWLFPFREPREETKRYLLMLAAGSDPRLQSDPEFRRELEEARRRVIAGEKAE